MEYFLKCVLSAHLHDGTLYIDIFLYIYENNTSASPSWHKMTPAHLLDGIFCCADMPALALQILVMFVS